MIPYYIQSLAGRQKLYTPPPVQANIESFVVTIYLESVIPFPALRVRRVEQYHSQISYLLSFHLRCTHIYTHTYTWINIHAYICFGIFHWWSLSQSKKDVNLSSNLDFNKIKSDLVTAGERKRALLLQALRWVCHLLSINLLSIICDRLWQNQAVGQKISFVLFSLQLINNNFCLKCWKNYYSIFYGSRDMNFITSSIAVSLDLVDP